MHVFFIWAIYCCIKGAVCLWLGFFVFWIMWTNFWTGGQNGVKLSGVARLVSSNFWVGSTLAQSPPDSTWPAPSPFAWGGAAPWSLVLPGHVIPFWKALIDSNNIVQSDFWFWAKAQNCGCEEVGHGKEVIFLNFIIFYKTDLIWNSILRDACIFAFWFEPPIWGA